MIPWIDEMMLKHPELSIKLNIGDSLSDFYLDRVDVALRYGEPEDSSMIAFQIATIDRVIIASPEYIASVRKPEQPEDLKQQLPLEIARSVADTLKEDLGGTVDINNDITASLIPADAVNTATIITREHGVFCGQAWADEVFKQLGGKVTIEWHVQDGDKVEPNQTLCSLTGPARALLTGERNAMNFIQTLSGCATTTAIYADKVKHTECRLLDTRKTIPGLRSALKYAVACGGGFNHRIDCPGDSTISVKNR